MYKHTQRSFAGGQIDRALMGRQDLAKYFTGASVLRNFLVRRQGNIAKRRGTDEAADVSRILGQRGQGGADIQIGNARLFPLVFDRENGYHILVTGHRAYLCSRRGVRAVTYNWLREIGPYDGTVDYAERATSEQTTPFVIGETGYATLQEAFDAAQDGDTIKVGQDVEIDGEVEDAVVGTVTLDLNGHVLTFVAEDVGSPATTAGLLRVTASGPSADDPATLVIDDSAGGGTITQPVSANVDLLAAFAARSRIVLRNGRVIARARHVPNSHARAAVYLIRDTSFEMTGGVLANETLADAPSDSTLRCAIIRCLGHTFPAAISLKGGMLRGATSNMDAIQPWTRTDLVVASSDLDVSIEIGAASICAEAIASLRSSSGVDTPHGLHKTSGSRYYAGFTSREEIEHPYVEGKWPTLIGLDTASAKANFAFTSGSIRDPSGDPDMGITGYDLYPIARYTGSLGQYNGVWQWSGDAIWDPVTPVRDSLDDEYWNPRGAAPVPSDDMRPFYTHVPWDDADLADVNYCQSGDTIFFAHRVYPPAKIEFDPARCTIAYSELDFAASSWQPPVITSVNLADMNKTSRSSTATSTTTTTYDRSSGVKTTVVTDAHGDEQNRSTTALAKRTVSYVASYVKDGVESPPSAPVSATYLLPWPEGDKITVNFNKGGNAVQPDEYRIYKKQGTEFGLIGTVGGTGTAAYDPRAEFWDAEDIPLAYLPRGSFDGRDFTTPSAADVKGRVPSDPLEDWSATRTGSSGDAKVWPGTGGISAKSAAFEFGEYSNATVGRVRMALDSHTVRYSDVGGGALAVADEIALSGTRISCRMRHRARTGGGVATTTLTKTLSPVRYLDDNGVWQTASTGTVVHCPEGTLGVDAGRAATAAKLGLAPRVAEFDFSSAINGRQTVDVTVWAEALTDGAWVRVPVRLAGIEFLPRASIGSSFDDDYITPDMSQTPVSPSHPFSGQGNFPGCVGIHQQRLVFASSRNDPTSVHMSSTGDLFDFSPHSSIREDDPISMSIAATEFPDVNHVVVTRDVMLLADGGEWKVAPVSGNTLTYKTISCSLQSRNGSARDVKPMAIGDEVVFADASGQNLLAIRYNYASDGYETTDMTVLAHDIFDVNRITQSAYEQFPDSRIKCTLADGRIAVMVYMKEHEVAAWSVCALGGGALARGVSCSRAIVGNTSDTAYLVRQGGAWRLWSVRPDVPEMTVAAQVCMDGVRTVDADGARAAVAAGMTAVDVATAAVRTAAGDIEDGRFYLVGWPFEAELVTVRPEPQGGGTIQFEFKNAKDVELRVLEGGSWRAAPFPLVDHVTYAQRVDAPPYTVDGRLALDSSDHRLLLSGDNGCDGRVQIKSGDAWPLSILSVSTDYEIQPLSNSEG